MLQRASRFAVPIRLRVPLVPILGPGIGKGLVLANPSTGSGVLKEQFMLQRASRFAVRLGLAAAAVLALCSLAAPAQQPVVDKFVLDDTIQPVSASELERAIAQANSTGARAYFLDATKAPASC